MVDIPESMDALLYFTNRRLEDGTRIVAWVNKRRCPACDQSLMSKPVNEKTGRPKIRSTVYVCDSCGHEEEKKAHEASSELVVKYSDETGKEWKDTVIPYKRRTWKGVPAFVFTNEFTGETVGITKKMKKPKKPKK